MKHPNMLEPTRTAAPATPIIPLGEAKHHLRVDGEDDDPYIMALVEAATAKLDGWNGTLGQAMITQTWRADYDEFPAARRLDLPLGPVQSVTVNYFDLDNVEQTFAASKYAVHEDASGPYLFLDEGEDSWPGTFDREDAARIATTVGFGDDPSDVPQNIRLAMLLLVAHWYERREAVTAGSEPSMLPWGVDALLADERRLRF